MAKRLQNSKAITKYVKGNVNQPQAQVNKLRHYRVNHPEYRQKYKQQLWGYKDDSQSQASSNPV